MCRNYIGSIVNKIRLLEEDLPNSKIVEKTFINLPERYEAKILSLKDSRDISKITLLELNNAFYAQEQRRVMRKEGIKQMIE